MCVTKNMKIYDPTLDLKTCGHISFDIISSNLRTDCKYLIYLRYIDSKVEKNINNIFEHAIRPY